MQMIRPSQPGRKGFNRNIVECKAGTNSGMAAIGLGFNRNIVECKVDN